VRYRWPGSLSDPEVSDADAVSIEESLAASRRGVRRLTAVEAMAATMRGALLIDTRTETQRAEQGELPHALVIDRTVLEWRLDPASEARMPEAAGYDTDMIVVCRQGYSSSLAAASLRTLGSRRVTDLIGGVEAWLAAGLPVCRCTADLPTYAAER
jgi:rhodanese-related sulfurtransferase